MISAAPPPPGTSRITDFDDAWATPRKGPRLRALRAAAERLRDRFVVGPRVVSVRTLPRTTLPYPARFAFGGAARSPLPWVVLSHRALLVQFFQRGALKNLLFNPTDVDAARATPFYARLAAEVPRRLALAVTRGADPIETQLARLGVSPADVDYVAFDHGHTQDLRGLVGTEDDARVARFPNATILMPRAEWDEWDDPHPMQRAWYVANGKRGVRTDKITLTTFDLALGDGVLLLRTPGHTAGNQTLFVSTDRGVWGISENGTAADNWSPLESRIPGLARAARRQEVDIVPNANTPESGADQYSSMVVERTIVDRVPHAPGFVQMFPSSEVTPSWFAPGLAPTIVHGAITSGQIAKPSRVADAPRRSRPTLEN